MSITLIKQPNLYHTSLNTNWWSFQSDMRFAPRFNVRAIIKDGSTIYNTVLLPTSPNTLNVLDIKNIMRDYVLPDFNAFIVNPTQSTSFKNYAIDTQETFEGLWIFGTSSFGTVGTVSVVNNTFLTGFATPSVVSDINFVGGEVTSPEVWAINYGTASNGFVNRINLSRSQTSFIPVTASVGSNSSGYLILADYNIYSNAATFSTSAKRAIIGNIDYLDYNETNNFNGYIMTDSDSKFLTNSPRVQSIQRAEWSTLSFLISTTQSVVSALYTDNFGATFSKSISGLSQSIKVDIPTGTNNLSSLLNPNATSYCVELQKTTPVSQFASAEFEVTQVGGEWVIGDNHIITWGTYSLTINNQFFSPALTGPSQLYTFAILPAYNSNANVSAAYNISFTGSDLAGICKFKLTSKVSGTGFNFTSLNISASSPNIFVGNVTSGASTIGLTASSERFCYEVDCLSSLTDSIRLCWLNRLGGIDYYTFRFTEQNGIKMVRDNYNRNTIYSTTKQDRGISTYRLDYHNEYAVVSDLLDDDMSEWLAELSSSTEVYLIRNNELIPITLIGTEYNWNTGFDNKEARFNFRLSRTNYN
jgi:hypothetical protein